MPVSYPNEQRKIAKEKKVRLYTIGVSYKGGDTAIMVQGSCGDKVAKIINDAIVEIIAVQTADKNNMYP